MGIYLKKLADLIGAEFVGGSDLLVEGVASLSSATSHQVSFLSSDKFLSDLSLTQAAAVILSPGRGDQFNGNQLVIDDPYLGYARAASFFHPFLLTDRGRSPTATIHTTASIAEGSWIGPQCTIMENVEIEEEVFVGAGTVIGDRCKIGRGSRLMSNVTLMSDTVVGDGCIIHSGAVLGSDGFGFAKDGQHWVKIPQLGRVLIGDMVEIGANSTIDRGALEDTIIENGVKIDNLVHIAHNVRVGENSAMAAMVGVAGSTDIGKGCTFGGQAGIVGHLEIVDGAHFTSRSMITRSIKNPGVYSSGIPADTSQKWRRNIVQFRKLNETVKRLRAVERRLDTIEQGNDK